MMLRNVFVFLLSGLALTLYGCGFYSNAPVVEAPCSSSWFKAVEKKVATGDGQGHGPDIGSMEWRSVVEFKLGVRGLSQTPNRQTTAWCAYIDDLVFTP